MTLACYGALEIIGVIIIIIKGYARRTPSLSSHLVLPFVLYSSHRDLHGYDVGFIIV